MCKIRDARLDLRDAEHVAHGLPRGSTRVWPGAGHYGFIDRDRWVQFLGSLST